MSQEIFLLIQWWKYSKMNLFTFPYCWSMQPSHQHVNGTLYLLGIHFPVSNSCCICKINNVSASKLLSSSISYSHNHKELKQFSGRRKRPCPLTTTIVNQPDPLLTLWSFLTLVYDNHILSCLHHCCSF